MKYGEMKAKLQDLLSSCRRLTICLDGWTAKGLSHSYLGISACFFDPVSYTPKHATIALLPLPHPHTGSVIFTALEKSLADWGISSEKVMLIVSDNGANVVKAVKLLQDNALRIKESQCAVKKTKHAEANIVEEAAQTSAATGTVANEAMADKDTDNEIDESDNGSIHDESSSADDGTDDEQYDGDDDKECPEPNLPLPELPESVLCRRMPCVAHTLQLVVKQVYRKHYAQIIMKARKVVSQIRRSSVAVEKLNRRCGKSLVADCTTRWNSTYMMAQRLLVIKSEVNDVLAEMGIDTLLVSEWAKLGEMASLLEPFATQTDILQTDALSLSYVLPSILELECHLQNFQSANQLTKLMLDDLQSRFSSILNPLCHQFNPLPAAACLLDHTVAPVLFSRDMQHLLEAAKGYIFSQVIHTVVK